MILGIEAATLGKIKNPKLAAYARQYVKIYSQYLEQVLEAGLEFSRQDERSEAEARRADLIQRGVQVRNDDKSLYLNRISPACEGCQTGIGSATFFVSLKCHRSCYYCFNPNQENYEQFAQAQRNVVGELQQIKARGQKIKYLALTGGEPLLYKSDSIAFFDYAAQNFPEAHTRLYTSGDHLDRATLSSLQAAGLQEIRLSIRMHDLEKGHREVFEHLALAKAYIPQVMVEMPILPGTLETMQEVLLELDRLQIHSINLLEFCFPFHNAAEFKKRGFLLKNPPYRVLYDYWYGGGLPIAGSELTCLDLLRFAADQKLQIGVHYCSLENKHTGQLYQQNFVKALSGHSLFSHKDYFLKSAKVFGAEVEKVQRAFRRVGFGNYEINSQYGYLEFPVSQIPALQDLSVEIGISSSVLENRAGERYLREVKVDVTTPQTFDLQNDL